MKIEDFVIQHLDTVQSKWYDVAKLPKITDARTNLKSIKEAHSNGKYRIIKRTLSEKTIK